MRNYIVLTSKEHYNPLGIVRTLGEEGIRPIVVAVEGDLKMILLVCRSLQAMQYICYPTRDCFSDGIIN